MSIAIPKGESPVFLIDPKGRKLGVVFSMKEYKRIMAILEDAHDIALADKRIKEPAIDQEELDKGLKRHGILYQ